MKGVMFALLLVTAAAAADQKLVYDLTVNGEVVGTREVTYRYLAREDGERRVIEAYTELSVAGSKVACRSNGLSTPRSAQFTSAVEQDGARSQVQGTLLPDGGWRLVVAEGKDVTERTLGRTEAQVTSLDLLDPVRNRVLTTPGAVGIVLVETGEVLVGSVGEGREGNIKVGGQKVPVVRYTVDGGAGGSASFDLDAEGLLLRSELSWLGVRVIATARDVPPPRSFGTVERIDEVRVEMKEEAL